MPIQDPKLGSLRSSSEEPAVWAEYSKLVIEILVSVPQIMEWPECRQILLDMLAIDESWMHALPVLACQAIGENEKESVSITAAWTILRHAANLMDDIQDGELYHYTQPLEPAIATTYAVAFIFIGFQILNELHLNPLAVKKITSIFARSGLDSVRGQYLDLIAKDQEATSANPLQAYWVAVIQKSGSIYYAGLAGAAAVGTDSDDLIKALGNFGIALGVIRQVIDDCRDIFFDTQDSRKPSTLPALLQATLSTEGAGISERLPELITDILEEWKRRALASLEILEPSRARDGLVSILNYVLQPVR